jgi:putative endopeptidase
MYKNPLPLMGLAALLAFASCTSQEKPKGQLPSASGRDELATHVDSTVKPGNDFFLFANGKWFKENPIKPSESTAGLWLMIEDTLAAQIDDICKKSATAKAPAGSTKQKIGDYYQSGMDSVRLNQEGINALKPELAKIDAITDINQLAGVIAEMHRLGSGSLLDIWVAQDDKISSKYAVLIHQGGLSLPDRDYYFDPELDSIRQEFVAFSKRMYMILGYSSDLATEAAERNMILESGLALNSRKIEDTRDPYKNYNKWVLQKLLNIAPAFDWKAFHAALGLKDVDSVIVGQPEFLIAVNKMLKEFPLEDWKNYLRLQLLITYSQYADDKTFMEAFRFFSTVLDGVETPQPRWKRVVEETNDALGELIGQVYVEEYLPKGTKEKLEEIGNAIRDVYAERIKNLDWMQAETKEKALEKLGQVVMKVGYPDKWKDMGKLEVTANSYLQNKMNANRWHHDYMAAKYGKPVDRTEWEMTPQTYNAYYNPSNNEIVVPGCNILIPGYEGRMADDAVLYAIIGGSTFGHEITHGFDDQGSKYDGKGNLSNWWTEEDEARFIAKTRRIVAQYNQYVPVDTLHINGEQTQGENIADLGGLVMGYEAFKRTQQFKDDQKIAGYTPTQRYFLGHALAWMTNSRPEALAAKVRSDVHSPAKYRVIGPVSNLPEFYEAFGVKAGDAMWIPDSLRVMIW